MIVVEPNYIHILTLLLLFGFMKEKNVGTGQLMLSPGEYVTFKVSLSEREASTL